MDVIQRCRKAVPSLFGFATFGVVLTLIPLGMSISKPPAAVVMSSTIEVTQVAALRLEAPAATAPQNEVAVMQPTPIAETTDAPPETVYTSIAATGDVMVSRRVLEEVHA